MKEKDIFRIIKLLYIILTVCALFALNEAIIKDASHISEGYLRPICDSIFATNGVLTAFSIIFREYLRLCTK